MREEEMRRREGGREETRGGRGGRNRKRACRQDKDVHS